MVPVNITRFNITRFDQPILYKLDSMHFDLFRPESSQPNFTWTQSILHYSTHLDSSLLESLPFYFTRPASILLYSTRLDFTLLDPSRFDITRPVSIGHFRIYLNLTWIDMTYLLLYSSRFEKLSKVTFSQNQYQFKTYVKIEIPNNMIKKIFKYS